MRDLQLIKKNYNQKILMCFLSDICLPFLLFKFFLPFITIFTAMSGVTSDKIFATLGVKEYRVGFSSSLW